MEMATLKILVLAMLLTMQITLFIIEIKFEEANLNSIIMFLAPLIILINFAWKV